MTKRQKKVPPSELCPDGVVLNVHWDKLVVGSSAFIPCMNTKAAKHALKRISDKRKIRLEMEIGIEAGVYGLRIWRTI